MEIGNMVNGILGKKVGMTQLFGDDGTAFPVTVIKAGPCVVIQQKVSGRDGYQAVQIGLVESKPASVNKAIEGHYKKAGIPPTRLRHEVQVVSGSEMPELGSEVLVSVFSDGDRVDVIGVSQGKGFQGVMKRHGFSGGAKSHGSMFHRRPGSIGASSYPSRVIKGMRGPGRMGGDRVTVRNLRVLRVDAENDFLLVNGAVPGASDGYVIVRKAVASRRPLVMQQEQPKKKK